jgi:hypothetical protein
MQLRSVATPTATGCCLLHVPASSIPSRPIVSLRVLIMHNKSFFSVNLFFYSSADMEVEKQLLVFGLTANGS